MDSLTILPSRSRSLAGAFAEVFQRKGDEPALIFLLGDEQVQTVSYAALWAGAQRAGARLLAAGIEAGDRLVLVGHHDAQLVEVFVGAILVGAVPAISTYLPGKEPASRAHQDVSVRKGVRFAKNSGARAILTPALWQEVIGEALVAELRSGADIPVCDVLQLDTPAINTPVTDELPQLPLYSPEPTTVAYIQLSSGTTGEAKGAPITHGALLAHIEQLHTHFELVASDVVVGWLPLSHDLGLITQFFLSLLSGFPSVLIAPDLWVRRPRMLTRAATTYRATLVFMPTFGYSHCTQHIRDEDLVGVDLSLVRVCLVGAEVIPAATMRAFTKRFGPWGLRDASALPAYGLAEAVCVVTLTPLLRGVRVDWVQREALQRAGRAIAVRPAGEVITDEMLTGEMFTDETQDVLSWVSCGVPLADTRIEIIDEAGKLLPERFVGRLLIHRDGLGAATIGNVANHDTQNVGTPGRVLTRDLGYMADGELYICGRMDDLIILGGANIYPEAIEMTALTVIGEVAGRAAAFGVRDRHLSTETAVLICEVRGALSEERERELNAAVRQAVRAQHEVVLGDLWLVRRGWIVSGESGKVARKATLAKYEAAGRMEQLVFLPEIGNLAQVDSAQVNALAQALADRVALMLGLTGAAQGVGVDDDLFDLGLTSLTATGLIAQARRERGSSVAIENWVVQPTCAHLASLLLEVPYRPQAPSANSTQDQLLDKSLDKSLGQSQGQPLTPQDIELIATLSWDEKLTNPQMARLFSSSFQRPKPNALHKWGIHRFIYRGPYIQNFGTLQLPYWIGIQLLRAWLSQPWIQKRFFAPEIQLLSGWFQLVGRPLDEQSVLRHLMDNTWHIWRRKAFQNAKVAARYLRVHGEVPWHSGQRDGHGFVVAMNHYSGVWILRDWLARQNVPNAEIVFLPFSTVSGYKSHMVKQLYQAGEVLQQGGIVAIAMDGSRGEGATVSVDVGAIDVDSAGGSMRLRRLFYYGAAELAIRHQAAMVPIEIKMGTDGMVDITIRPALTFVEPPLETGRSQDEARARALMEKYTSYYHQSWPQEVEHIRWGMLTNMVIYADRLLTKDLQNR